MTRARVVAAGVMWLVLGLRDAEACSCALYINDPVEAMEASSLVIAAKVTSISRVEGKGEFDGHPMPLVRFTVLTEWKGTNLREYSAFAWYAWPIDGKGDPTPMFDCVHQVKVGESYLVFAKPLSDGQGQWIDVCLPGAPYREAGDMIATLDKATHRKNPRRRPTKSW